MAVGSSRANRPVLAGRQVFTRPASALNTRLILRPHERLGISDPARGPEAKYSHHNVNSAGQFRPAALSIASVSVSQTASSFLRAERTRRMADCAIGRADHEGMQPDDYCCGVARRIGAGLVGQFQHIV